MMHSELLIYYKEWLICRLYAWDEVEADKTGIIVYHGDDEPTSFIGLNYTYKIVEVES